MKKRLFCLVLVLCFLLSACGTAAREEDPEPRQRHRSEESIGSGKASEKEVSSPVPDPSEEPEPEAAPEPTPELTPEPTPEPTPVPDPVVNVFEREGDYSDDVGNSYHYVYRIPAFTCDSADAENMNQAFRDFADGYIEDALAVIDGDEKYSLILSEVDYGYAQSGDFVSVLCWMHNDWGQTEYCARTIDLWTQREASRETLLAYAGLNDQSFLERAREAAGETFGDYTQFSGDLTQFAEDQYHKTVMDENLQDTQLFIDGESRLCMVVRVFSIAGADYYWHVVPLQ